MSRIKKALYGLLVLFLLFGISYNIPTTYSQMETAKAIFNHIWDRSNSQLMAVPWSGPGEAIGFETIDAILNNVYDPSNNMLRISGGYQTFTTATLPATCTPGRIYEVTDAVSDNCALQRCGTDSITYSCLVPPAGPNLLGTAVYTDGSSLTGINASTLSLSTDTALGVAYKIDATVGANGITLTLPPIATAPVTAYHIHIIDSGVGFLTIAPSGSDTLNGAAGVIQITGKDSLVDIELFSNTWSVVATKTITPGGSTPVGYFYMNPNSAKFPSSNPATLDNSETNSRLLFDNITSQCAFWQGMILPSYSANPVFTAVESMVSVTSGSLHLDVSVMVQSDTTADVNTESYDTANNCNIATVPGTAGYTKTVSCNLTNNDTMAGGKYFKVKVCRDVANDDAAGVSEYLSGVLTYDLQ